jgi:hypothetical protein
VSLPEKSNGRPETGDRRPDIFRSDRIRRSPVSGLRSPVSGLPLFFLALLLPAFALADEEDGFLVERDTVEINPAASVKIQRLDIDNRLGDITVIGRDAPGVTLSVVKRGPDEEVLDRLKINLVPDPGDGTVRISSALLVGKEERPVAAGTLRVDIKIYAPRGASVAARAWNGKVGVTGMENGADITAHDSDIVVTNVRGAVSTTSMRGHQRLSDVSGRVSAEHTYGDVALDAIDGDSLAARVHRGTVTATRIRSSSVALTTTFGDIHFRGELAAGGHYELRSYKGNIEARTTGPFQVDAMGGAVEPDVELVGSTRSAGRITGHYGAGEHPAMLLMKSAAGRVTFGLSQPLTPPASAAPPARPR